MHSSVVSNSLCRFRLVSAATLVPVAAFALALTLLGTPPTALAQQAAVKMVATEAALSPLAKGLKQDMEYLASDELKGRSAIDPAIFQARDYLVKRMSEIGLQMDSVDGTPLQPVTIATPSRIDDPTKNTCQLTVGETVVELEVGDGFTPLILGAPKQKVTGPLAFVGYGVTSLDPPYDDYAGLDVKGAIVMMIRKEPGPNDANSPFDGKKNTSNAFFASKVKNAIAHGAAAVILVNDQASIDELIKVQERRIGQEQGRIAGLEKALAASDVENPNGKQRQLKRSQQMLKSLQGGIQASRRGLLAIDAAGSPDGESRAIPVISVARDIVSDLLKAAGQQSVAELEGQINRTYKPSSVILANSEATVSVDLTNPSFTSENVIGRLPGKGDLADEIVVVGAHYDHVGMGGTGSLAPGTIAVHNGADDNASGTVTMLGTATNLTDMLQEVASHRTVLFIGFTGEERGLLGSKHYVKKPVLPIEKTSSMLNLDMVGRLKDNELYVYGVGTSPSWKQLIQRANAEFGFKLIEESGGYGPSDHDSFTRSSVPVLFYFTGLHNDYHRPSDDFDKIDFGDLARITDMVSKAAFEMVTMPQRPSFAQTPKGVQIRKQRMVYLGVQLSSDAPPVTVVSVLPGSPAAKAGLEKGDQIQKIGKAVITTNNDLQSWVRARSPQENFEITVLREGQQQRISGKLEKRPD